MVKKSSNGQALDETSASTGQTQIKLMPILEGGENDDKSIEQPTNRLNLPSTITTTTLDWTPAE